MASLIDLIKHYQHNIEKYPDDEQKVLRAIDKLFQLEVKVQHLQETGVGRTVNSLRKEPGMVGKAARALVYKWKLMVASEESDQEDDHNDSSTHNGSEKDSDDGNRSHSKSNHDNRQINGDHSGSKRKYHSSEGDEPDRKKSRHSASSDSEGYKKADIKPKPEPQSDSQSSDSNSESDSESESSEEEKKPAKIKTEPEDKPSSSKYTNSNHNHQIKTESSSSKRSHESSEQNGSKHTKHNSESKHSSDKSSKSTHSSKEKHSTSKDKETSSDKKDRDQKSDKHKSKDKEERSSSKHSSEREKSSSQKTDCSSDRHRSHEKSKSEKHSNSSKSDKEKHKSSSEKEFPDKHTSKESSSSKDRSSSSKEKPKEKSSSKDKERSSSSSHSKSEKKSSSEKSDRDKSKSDSRSKSEKEERSSEKKSSHKSSSSDKSKSSSSKSKDDKVDKPKKSVTINTANNMDSDDDGIGCESGASFAEALGMVLPPKPSKKKPSTPVKDAFSPNNTISPHNDLSPASLLAPTAKLMPLPALEISALPEISPNYKPRPPPKFIPHFTEEELGAAISSKNQRTKVYSGNKIIGKIPSLYDMCVQILQEHIDALEYTGGVPYEILKPIVDKATPQQLFVLEHYNPYLMEDTDHLWKKHCEKNFRTKKREEMESWREMYMRCQEEQEYKLKSLTANIKMTQEAKKAPIKQTKMAYVDSVVKPPRNIARKQAMHGTAHMATASPAARVASLSTSSNVLKGGVRAPPAPPTSSSSFKPKKAPLMAKALQLMRGRKR